MSKTEQDLKDLELEIIKAIEKFEKEHKVFMVEVAYDGFDRGITYTFAGENFKFTKN